MCDSGSSASVPGPPACRQTRLLAALLLFGLAFGYVEAAVAIYLRGLYEPLHQQTYPGGVPGDLFPLLPLERLREGDGQAMRWLGIELGREAATIVLLAALGLAVGRTFLHGFAVFLIGFGLWDIFYYVFLEMLIGWPASLFTWDLLFLLPVPWVGPVLAPLLVAVGMIGSGLVILRREARGQPLRFRWLHWVALVAGGLIILAAFCEDSPRLLAGGMPGPFNWTVFAFGAAVGLAAFGHACRQ